jgi:mono/diheme cytochrome c family protein
MAWTPGSRRRIVLWTVALLLVLDVARSVYARAGHAQPESRWEPDPKDYANLTWPPGEDAPADGPVPKVYARYCATCHGPDGRANGPAAPEMIPRPLDFTQGQFKYKSTPAGQPPSDADLERTIVKGLQASAMPYFGDILGADDVRRLVAHIKTLSSAFTTPPQPLTVSPRVPPDASSIARGRSLYAAQGCPQCHGPDGRSRAKLADAKGHTVFPTDLTAPWTFRGGSEPEQVWLRLTTGLAPGPMPSIAGHTTPGERWDIVNYVLSLARVAPWEPGGKLDGPGHHADPRTRGEYLVHGETCGLCHNQLNSTGIYRTDEAYLAGGQRALVYPQAVFVGSNLTSDPETGVGKWTPEQIASALRTGRAPDRLISMWGMPWMHLYNFTQEDAVAVGHYLKTVRPVFNRIPDPLRYGFVETVVAKMTRPFPAADPLRASWADGNYGKIGPGLSRAVPNHVLIWAQWLVLAAGVVLFVRATPPGQRRPRRFRTWAALVGLPLLGWVNYQRPVLRIFPPALIANVATGDIPRPDPARLGSPERAALAERGRYIYAISTCAMCHGNDGSGGKRISWIPHGTLYMSNVTPDVETGIGLWSDAEIARAIRGGISRGGRVLHWQGMPWDYLSNFDEEDIRAVVAYLRTLPPVKHQVPAMRPPNPDDCAIYTFWIHPSTTAGCAR